MRIVILASLLALSACAGGGYNGSTPPPPGPSPYPSPIPAPPPGPPPATGAIVYNCANGTQLMVDESDASARVAIIGGPSMVLPNAGDGYYSNGRYGLRGTRESAQWEVGNAAPVACRGS